MQLSSPVDAVSRAVNHAALVALPAVQYQKRDHAAMATWTAEERMEAARTRSEPTVPAERRPELHECELFAMFAQTWGSTALGFGGIGGAAMTPAYTTVVLGPTGEFAVYWSGRFAYLVDPNKQSKAEREAFLADLGMRQTASRMEATVRYGAILPY